MPGITADLTIDYSEALAGGLDLAAQLEAALASSAQSAQQQLEAAFTGSAAGGLDLATQLEAALTAAVDSTQSLLQTAFAAGSDEANTLGNDLTTDLSNALNHFENAWAVAIATLTSSPVDVPFEVDPASLDNAQAAIADLGKTAQESSGSVESLGRANLALEAGASAAVGEVGGLKAAVGEFGGPVGTAAIGTAAALTGGLTELFHAGLDATSAQQRFNQILGETAKVVEQVHVGDLSTTLDDLAKKMGSTSSATQQAVASIFQFASNSGASRAKAAEFSDQVYALAARAVALKPALGDVADVADSLSLRVARGGRFAAAYGLSLSAAEINARALATTHKSAASELTIFEKAQAGVQIAVEKYGKTLDGTIAEGSKNAAIQQRQLRAELTEILERLGQPIVSPVFQIMHEALPTVEALGRLLSDLGRGALPLVAGALVPIGVVAKAVADGLEAIPGPLLDVIGGMIALKLASTPIMFLLNLTTGALATLGEAAAVEGTAVATAATGMATGVATASTVVEAALGPIGLIAAALTVGVTAFGLFGAGAEETSQHLKDFEKAVTDANGAINNTAFNAASSLLQERHQIDDLAESGLLLKDVLTTTASATKGQRDQLGELADTTHRLVYVQQQQKQTGQDLSGTTAGLRAAQEHLIAQIRIGNPELAQQLELLRGTGNLNEGVVRSLVDLAGGHSKAAKEARDLAKAQADANSQALDYPTLASAATKSLDAFARGTGTAAQALKDEASAQSEANDGLKLYEGHLKTIMGLQGDVFGATIAMKDAEQKLTESVQKNGTSFDITTQAGRDNAKALADLSDKAATLADSTYKRVFDQTHSVSDATREADKVMSDFQANALTLLTKEFGLSDEAAQGLLTQLGVIPANAAAAARALGSQVPAALGTLHSSFLVAGAQLGHSFGDGFGAGINESSGGISAAAQRAAEAAAHAARIALGISSPSRVAAETIGQPFSEGIAVGILQASPDVLRAMEAAVTQRPSPQSLSLAAFGPGPSAGGAPISVTVPVTVTPSDGMSDAQAAGLGATIGQAAVREIVAVVGAL